MEQTVSLPNDKIAVIVEMNDNKNNTYTLVPVLVTIGKVDNKGYFISENGSESYPPITNPKYLLDSETKRCYAFLDVIDNVKEKYKGIDNLSMIEYSYLKDIASKLNLALLSDEEVHIFSKDYKNISPQIDGDTIKTYSKEIEPETKEEIKEEILPTEVDSSLSQEGLEKYLKERIIGNDEILEDIATTIILNQTAQEKSEVEAILGVGPTGSGKTATFEAVSEYLGIPLTIYDCNELTATGYVGKDIDDVMRKIYTRCEGDKKKAERSILVLDEIDKLSMRGNDVKEASVQYSLLKLLDGYEYVFETKKNSPQVTLDSSFLTIACIGAFPDMYAKYDNVKHLGFGTEPIKVVETRRIFTPDDFVSAGMLREFIGRCQNIESFKKLNKDDLKEILLHSKNSSLIKKINRYKREFGVTTTYEDAFIDYLVELAYSENTGGRSLNTLIAKIFKRIDRELLREKNKQIPVKTKKLVLTKELVENNHSFNI